MGRVWACGDGRAELAQYKIQCEQNLYVPMFVDQGPWKGAAGEAWRRWVWALEGRSGEMGWVDQRNTSLEDSAL